MRLGHGTSQFLETDLDWINDGGAPAVHWPANSDGVATVIAADPDLKDGFTRSEWLWIRLANGDLILGIYPQDDTYQLIEGYVEQDYNGGINL